METKNYLNGKARVFIYDPDNLGEEYLMLAPERANKLIFESRKASGLPLSECGKGLNVKPVKKREDFQMLSDLISSNDLRNDAELDPNAATIELFPLSSETIRLASLPKPYSPVAYHFSGGDDLDIRIHDGMSQAHTNGEE